MRGIILLVHGNRRPSTRTHFERIADRLSERLSLPIGVVLLAAVEPIESQMDLIASEWIDKPVTDVDVVPMLLGPGRHLEEDVPLLVDCIQCRFPHWDLKVVSMLGDWPELIDAMATKLLSPD